MPYQTASQTKIKRICWYLISRNNYNIHNNSYPLPDNVSASYARTEISKLFEHYTKIDFRIHGMEGQESELCVQNETNQGKLWCLPSIKWRIMLEKFNMIFKQHEI